MSIAYGGLVALFFRGLNLILGFGLVWLTSNELGGGGRGTYVLGATVVGFIAALTGGLTASAAYQVSNQQRSDRSVLVSGSLPTLALALLVVAGGFAGMALDGNAGVIAPAIGLAASAVIVTSPVTGLLLGRDSFFSYNIARVVPPAFSLAALGFTFLVLDRTSAEASLYAFAVGQWVAFPVILLSALAGSSGSFRLEGKLARALTTFGLFAALSSTVAFLNYRADLFVIEHFEGSDGVGVFGNAVYVAEAVWQLSGSLALAVYARLGSLEAGPAADLTARIMRHTVIVLGIFCTLVFLVAGVAVDLVFSDDFSGMTSSIRILIPGTLVYSLGAALSGFYNYNKGMPWVAAVIAGSALLIDLVLAFILVPEMGIDGAALATSISYVIAMGIAFVFFLRTTGLSPLAVFRYTRADLDDYRSLVSRLSGVVRRS